MKLTRRLSSKLATVMVAIALALSASLFLATDEAYAADRTLPYSSSVVSSVGTQVSTGHSQCCPAFCCAYGDTMLTGEVRMHTAYGLCMNCEFSGWSMKTGNLSGVVSQIDSGKPVVLHVVNKSGWGNVGGEHWVLVVGYKSVSGSVSLSNLVILDPWDGKQVIASSRYNRHSDGKYYVTNKSNTVGGHTCSFPVKGYAPRNDMNHHIYYNACSCGKTRSDGVGDHTLAWSGLSNVCTKCGRAETSHGTGYDYLAKKDLALYAESNWNNRIGTVPADTVLTPISVKAGVGGGYWMAQVNYNGTTGWVTLADCMRNGTAGKHSFVDGVCSDCGMAESYSDLGVYKSSKSVTLYKSHPYAEDKKTVSAGTSIIVSNVGVTTSGYYWGYTPDGYVFSMDLLTDQVSAYPYNGVAATVAEGKYLIHSAGDYNLVVDVSSASTAIRAVIQIYMENRSVAQQFDFISNGDGTYRIQNANSGMVVEAKGWSKVNGAVIQQYTWSGDDNQRWYVEDNGDGTISLRNKISNLYLTVVDGSIVSGQDLQQRQPDGSTSQRFMLERVDGSANPALTAYDTQIIGIEESYEFTGQAVEPKPVVRRLVWFADSLRVPNTGVGTHSHTNSISKPALTQPALKGGRTYVVEVDSVTALAGSFSQTSMFAYNVASDKGLSPMYYLEVGVPDTQSLTIEPTGDGTLLFYCATNGTSLNCASLYEGIRVYEVLDEGTDYTLSYTENINVGSATVTVTGAGSYFSTMNAGFEIVESASDGGSEGAATALPGDVQEDGELSVCDTLLLQQYLTELVEFTSSQKALADVNNDSSVNMKDLVALAKLVASLDV